VAGEVAKQAARLDASAYRVHETSETLVLRVAEVFLEVLRRKQLLELAKDNLVIHQKIGEHIRAMEEGGAGRKADVQQSQSREALAKSLLVGAQGSLRDADTNYRRITGENPPADLLKPAAEIAAPALPATLEAAVDTALANSPAVKAAEAEMAAAEAAYEQSRSRYMPTVTLELGASKNDNLDGVEGANDDATAMLRMRYNLFRGGADAAYRQESAERLNAARESLSRARRAAEEEARLAWNTMLTARERLEYLHSHTKSSEAVVASYKQQFKLGQRSLLDVLDSEYELYNSRVSLASARYLELLSQFRVLASQGQLLATFNLTPPAEARLPE
jgi:adhesin transport system outer membrane protein